MVYEDSGELLIQHNADELHTATTGAVTRPSFISSGGDRSAAALPPASDRVKEVIWVARSRRSVLILA